MEFCSARLGFVPDAKKAVAAARTVFRAITRPGSLILFCSPSERQSAELLRKPEGFVRKLGIAPKSDEDNQQLLLFPNESCIVVLPGTDATVRGISAVSLLESMRRRGWRAS